MFDWSCCSVAELQNTVFDNKWAKIVIKLNFVEVKEPVFSAKFGSTVYVYLFYLLLIL